MNSFSSVHAGAARVHGRVEGGVEMCVPPFMAWGRRPFNRKEGYMFSIPGSAGQLDDVFDGVPLTDTAKAVYAAIVQIIQAKGYERFSLGEVRARAGCTTRELKRALMELDVFNIIGLDEIYGDEGFSFEFCFPDEGEEPRYVGEVPDAPWDAQYSAFSLRHGWAMLDASPSVKLVLAFLHASVGGVERHVPLSQGEIAEYTGLSRSAVSKAVRWLADNMVIRKWESRNDDGGTDVCEYVLTQIGVWAQDAH